MIVSMNISGLAKYLHLSPQQVQKLVDRDGLPCRRVKGEYQFNRAEIHHWLEERLGIYDDKELARVETALEQSAPSGNDDPRLSDMVFTELSAYPLAARTRESVIRAMVELATHAGYVWDPDRMIDAIRSREELMSTAMDNGVAILHPRRPLPDAIAQPFVALGVTSQGIPFGGSRTLTDVFFFVASEDDRPHLRTLARLSRILQRETFLPALREAEDASQFAGIIASHEADVEEIN